MDGFSVVRYELSASVHSAIDPEDQLMACRVASRGSRVGASRGDLNAGMPWLALDGPITARWSERADVRAFVFDRSAAQQLARQMCGDDRFALRDTSVGASPIHRDLAAHWERTFQHVSASLLSGDRAVPMIEAELRRHALHTTLTVFSPAFALAVERGAQRDAAPRSVRRAIAFIEENAHLPVTVDDIAGAAGISTRGLQYAFRRATGLTPTAYLRSERLSRAHAELQQGIGMPVAEVARRWGFASASRFAKHYRDAYGRTPTQTRRG